MWQHFACMFAAVVIVNSSELICENGAHCAHIYDSTTGFDIYKLNGIEIAINESRSHLNLNCNNHDFQLDMYPKFDITHLYSRVSLNNCIFQASDVKKLFDIMKINTDYLVLNNCYPLRAETFKDLNLNGLEINNASNIHKDLLETMMNLKEFNLVDTNMPLDMKIPSSLRMLKLTNNYMIMMPNLKHIPLEKLMITQNELQIFPPNINENSIKYLDLSMNRLRDLPTDLMFVNIEELHLQNNLINGLDGNIFANTMQLTYINMSYNTIEVLPEDLFNRLSKLHTLDLSHNNINIIDAYTFPGSSGKLTNLDLSYNNLTSESLCPHGKPRLGFLENLQVLNLSHNNIENLCLSLLQSLLFLRRLTMLDLSYNNFTYLLPQNFQFESKSITVNYGHNKISTMQFAAYDYWNPFDLHQSHFILEPNPIICDGLMQFFIKITREKKLFETNIQDVECFQPAELKHRFLSTINENDLDGSISCDTINYELPNCLCSFSEHLTVNCSNNNILIDDLWTQLRRVNDLTLVLENCSLSDITNFTMFDLIELHVARNNISRVPLLSDKMQVLDIRDNNITRLSSEEVSKLMSVKSAVLVSGNAIECDCDNYHFVYSIIAHAGKIIDSESTYCSTGEPLHIDTICVRRGMIVTAVILLILTIITYIVAMYFKYRLSINAILYSRGWCLPFLYIEELEKEKQYDAFVSYAHGDEEFITKQLLPKLEHQFGYKLCVHHRDWLIGPDIPSQILSSVEDSRRTIVVLSKNFLNSIWGKAEFRAATNETVRTGLPRVIVIVLPDITELDSIDPELKIYLDTNTYFLRNDPLFWQKLCFAMPHKKYTGKGVVLLSKNEEKKRMKRVKRIADYVEKEFAKRKSNVVKNPEPVVGKFDNKAPNDGLVEIKLN